MSFYESRLKQCKIYIIIKYKLMQQIKSGFQQDYSPQENQPKAPEQNLRYESKSPEKCVQKPKPKKIPKTMRQAWNPTEERRYIKFLKTRQYLFHLPMAEKRKVKLNIQMSKIVKTKNSTQCHSHHQKMVKKHGSIEFIIQKMQHLLSFPYKLPSAASRNPSLKVQHQPTPVTSVNIPRKQKPEQDIMKQESEPDKFYIRFFAEEKMPVKLEDQNN